MASNARSGSSELAPIVLFAYNRVEHLRRTVDSLRSNRLAGGSDLVIFSDAPRNAAAVEGVREVRSYIRTIEGFRSLAIREREENFGLARSIIDGVGEVLDAHDRVIVLEDDIVTSPWFLSYMNDALTLYEHDERVASIHGYSYPTGRLLPETFFLRGADCWGWATWRNRWQLFDRDGARLLQALIDRGLQRRFDLDGAFSYTQMLRDQIAGRNDSWAVRWHASCFLQDKLTLYPGRSLVTNIGTDASGTHCDNTTDYAARLAETPVKVERIALEESEEARRAFARFLRRAGGGLIHRLLRPLISRLGVLGSA